MQEFRIFDKFGDVRGKRNTFNHKCFSFSLRTLLTPPLSEKTPIKKYILGNSHFMTDGFGWLRYRRASGQPVIKIICRLMENMES